LEGAVVLVDRGSPVCLKLPVALMVALAVRVQICQL
jgi:hypothetical protein